MMERIDVKSVVTNGVIQISAGAVSVIFTIAGYFFTLFVNNYVGAGIWSGLFFVAGGIVTVVAGVKRSFCCVVASLTLAVIGMLVGSINLWIQVQGLAFFRFRLHCWSWYGKVEDCSDLEYRVAVGLAVIVIIAAFAQLVAAVWAVVLASRAIRDRKVVDATTTTSDFANRHAKSSSIMVNSIAQATTAVVSMLTNVIVLFIVAYSVQSGKNDQRELIDQTSGSSLWVGPVFLLAAFLGFRAARNGENSSLIAFLCLNVVDVFLAPFCEIVGPAVALANRWWSMKTCDFDRDRWDGRNCSYEFVTPLVVLNSIIIVAAVAHLAFAIWGIVAAAVALHRDKTCLRCCGCSCCCPRLDEDTTTTTQIRYVVASPQSMQSTTVASGNIVLIPATDRNDRTSDSPAYEPAMMNGSHVAINGYEAHVGADLRDKTLP